jgi:hypothetical protein
MPSTPHNSQPGCPHVSTTLLTCCAERHAKRTSVNPSGLLDAACPAHPHLSPLMPSPPTPVPTQCYTHPPFPPVVLENMPDHGRVGDHDSKLSHNAVPGQTGEGVCALALPESMGVLHHLHNAAQEGNCVAGACACKQKTRTHSQPVVLAC